MHFCPGKWNFFGILTHCDILDFVITFYCWNIFDFDGTKNIFAFHCQTSGRSDYFEIIKITVFHLLSFIFQPIKFFFDVTQNLKYLKISWNYKLKIHFLKISWNCNIEFIFWKFREINIHVGTSDGFGYPKTRNPAEKPDFFGTWTREIVLEPDRNPTFAT